MTKIKQLIHEIDTILAKPEYSELGLTMMISDNSNRFISSNECIACIARFLALFVIKNSIKHTDKNNITHTDSLEEKVH